MKVKRKDYLEHTIRLYLALPLPVGWYFLSTQEKQSYVRKLMKDNGKLHHYDPYVFRKKIIPEEIMKECLNVPDICQLDGLKRRIKTIIFTKMPDWLEAKHLLVHGYKVAKGYIYNPKYNSDERREAQWKELMKERDLTRSESKELIL